MESAPLITVYTRRLAGQRRPGPAAVRGDCTGPAEGVRPTGPAVWPPTSRRDLVRARLASAGRPYRSRALFCASAEKSRSVEPISFPSGRQLPRSNDGGAARRGDGAGLVDRGSPGELL